MRRLVFISALIIGLQASITTFAQNNTVTLKVPNFVRPLVEKCITEYKKTDGTTDFQFVSGKSKDNNSILFTTTDDAIPFARYAVLPVTTADSEALHLIGQHRLNAKKLKSLFFVKDEFDEEDEGSKKKELPVHVYTGNNTQSASHTYASYFKQDDASYKGKKIVGDDSFLTIAIGRDPLGVTVNSLPNIFDLSSRHVRNGLALLPLEVDRQGRQTLDEGDLDKIIALLEGQEFSEIPVGNVGVEYDRNNDSQRRFVRWILENGVGYVHEFGLLQLSQKELAVSLRLTDNNSLAQK